MCTPGSTRVVDQNMELALLGLERSRQSVTTGLTLQELESRNEMLIRELTLWLVR
jgi:hypothetical protein